MGYIVGDVIMFKVPDYLRDYQASKTLVDNIERYWHSRGHTKVKAWIETLSTAQGDKTYVVRSNIFFSVPKV